MPVGPLYVDGTSPSCPVSSRLSEVTETGIGRVCGVSASRAPSRCTRLTCAEASAEAIKVLNCRHRRFGSNPCPSTSARPLGSRPTRSSVVGQISSRSSASDSSTCGRFTWKSK